MTSVDESIDKTVGEVRTESLDMSFGEILTLYGNREIIIYPEYQRLFRWSTAQESQLIESILLGLPVPPIFVMEKTDGVFELIDGLQRITSIIHFVDPAILQAEGTPPPIIESLSAPLRLEGCDIITSLNGLLYEDLSLRLKLRVKRVSVRMVIIRRQSSPSLRYEMFKRLNTGGALLSPQEIRNCTVRMIGEPGEKFYGFIQKCSANENFCACTETLSDESRSQKGDEELVLRFFALKNEIDGFKGNVKGWLDRYMENVILENVGFDYDSEEKTFNDVFSYIASTLGPSAFVRFKGDDPLGGLKPAFFEAIVMGVYRCIDDLITKKPDPEAVRKALHAAVQTNDFKEVTGGGANSRPRLLGRIDIIFQALSLLVR